MSDLPTIKVRRTDRAGGFNGYCGPNHDVPVSHVTAVALTLGPIQTLPRMGYEVPVASCPEKQATLFLANISGTYWLRCHNWSVDHWPAVFGVAVMGAEWTPPTCEYRLSRRHKWRVVPELPVDFLADAREAHGNDPHLVLLDALARYLTANEARGYNWLNLELRMKP